MGTGLALALAGLLIALGLAVSVLTWRRPAPASEHAEVASSAPAAVPAQVAAPPSENRAGRVGRLMDGSSAEELARRLQDAPQARWAYALRSNDHKRRAAPPAPPPRRIVSVVPEPALGFAWPLAGVITSAFTDEHPLGIDIGPTESPGLVLAARDGVVVLAGGDPCCGYGYVVLLDHGGGLTSLYGHLQEPPLVRAGERLERGTVLGHAGETGHTAGVHLHFEVRLHGVPVDPELVLTGGRLAPLPVRSRPTPTPTPTPAPRSTPVAAVPPDTASVERTAEGAAPPPAASPPGSPEPSPSPVPATTPPFRPALPPFRSPVARAAPAPSPPPERAATPAPAAAPSPSAVAGTSPSEPATAAALTPAASPRADAAEPSRCDTIRLATSEERTEPDENAEPRADAPPAFIALEADAQAVTSLVAERCQGSTRISVVATPAGNRRCGATLTAREGDRSRRLAAEQTPDGEPAPSGETRWLIPLADLWPDPVLRIVCTPVEAMTDSSDQR